MQEGRRGHRLTGLSATPPYASVPAVPAGVVFPLGGAVPLLQAVQRAASGSSYSYRTTANSPLHGLCCCCCCCCCYWWCPPCCASASATHLGAHGPLTVAAVAATAAIGQEGPPPLEGTLAFQQQQHGEELCTLMLLELLARLVFGYAQAEVALQQVVTPQQQRAL